MKTAIRNHHGDIDQLREILTQGYPILIALDALYPASQRRAWEQAVRTQLFSALFEARTGERPPNDVLGDFEARNVQNMGRWTHYVSEIAYRVASADGGEVDIEAAHRVYGELVGPAISSAALWYEPGVHEFLTAFRAPIATMADEREGVSSLIVQRLRLDSIIAGCGESSISDRAPVLRSTVPLWEAAYGCLSRRKLEPSSDLVVISGDTSTFRTLADAYTKAICVYVTGGPIQLHMNGLSGDEVFGSMLESGELIVVENFGDLLTLLR